jgi:carboxymethylenebutenolidase
MHETHTITTADGACTAHVFHPAGDGPWPAVLFYMDGVGLRPALFGMGERLAGHGYLVLMPDLYYRTPHEPFDIKRAFGGDEAEKSRMIAMVRTVTHEKCNRDTDAFLAFLDKEPRATARTGVVGYCMGGSLALTAAARHPERIQAAAAFHASRLGTDAPDSPHLVVGRIRAEVYVGIAGLDPSWTPAEEQRLVEALVAGNVRHTVETYPGVKHGFAVDGSPVHDADAAERHFRTLLSLFERTLR